MVATIFKDMFDKVPHYIEVDAALKRIREGKSKGRIADVRNQLDKERAGELKKLLPAVCFSGKFTWREDDLLQVHSGFIVLDFDKLEDLREKQIEVISSPFVYACWVSPSGKGLKALVKIADGSKHREHFAALKDFFPTADSSGVNEARVCYESYDPDMYLNKESEVFRKTKHTEVIEVKETLEDETAIFDRIVRWLVNKGDAFVSGERNNYIYKLASACCRFGLQKERTEVLVTNQYLANGSTFSKKEAVAAIKSAYRSKKNVYASAVFEKDILVDKTVRKEVQIDADVYDLSIRPKDVIFGEDVKAEALAIYQKGYAKVDGIQVPALDELFKEKRGEITLLSGMGNAGKSTYCKWRILMRVLLYENKFAIFGPEDNPAEEFYHDFVEMILGCDCTPGNPLRPSQDYYEAAYDFVSKNIFYVYPKEMAPTPEYIKERFLELAIKENIDGCVVDPFNQLSNDYSTSGGRTDKYLETALSDWARFAQANNVFFTIIAHPHKLKKEPDGNYPCPDVFDIADGAMWNNKMDNIIIYHRPKGQTEPNDPTCEVHSKKIRRQKQVGKKGSLMFEMIRSKRRFFVNSMDYMQAVINEKDFPFSIKKTVFTNTGFRPDESIESF